MLISIHEEMTREALRAHTSPRALEVIIAANCKQDSLRGLIGHDEFHYDNNAIEKSNRYINEQRGYVLATLMSRGILSAWIAFGRLIHTAQDFYAHTNYISMWLSQHEGTPLSPLEIDPVQKDILRSPSLHSGKIYLPMDALYFIPALREFSLKLLPRDSHGHMNLDSPQQGPNFAYARAAAVKRTQHEFGILQKLLTPDMLERFVDK
ncbi:MAG: hypothetical protein AABZ00_09355 [Chloroflexota bacterium]